METNSHNLAERSTMLEPLHFPNETNAQIRTDMLADKINEIIKQLNENKPECPHTNTRVLKNGRNFCEDCNKFIK